MSQRCLVAFRKNVDPEKDGGYDCIYDENADHTTLLNDWLAFSKWGYLGPWKLRIRDRELYEDFLSDCALVSKICRAFTGTNSCWSVYFEDSEEAFRNEDVHQKMTSVVNAVMKNVSQGDS